MNWYKKAQVTSEMASQLAMLDTRSKKDVAKANEIILKALNLKVGDVVRSITGMSSGPDKNYLIESINDNFSVNLLAQETQRKMPNVSLYNFAKRNMPAWEKVS